MKAKQETLRLNSVRFGNLQTKFIETEKELGNLQKRFDTLLNRLHEGSSASSETNQELFVSKENQKALQKSLDEKLGEIDEKNDLLIKKDFELVDKDVQIGALKEQLEKEAKAHRNCIQHNKTLQEELNLAKAPEKICFTTHGAVYHKTGCRHVQKSSVHEMRKCKDCLP